MVCPSRPVSTPARWHLMLITDSKNNYLSPWGIYFLKASRGSPDCGIIVVGYKTLCPPGGPEGYCFWLVHYVWVVSVCVVYQPMSALIHKCVTRFPDVYSKTNRQRIFEPDIQHPLGGGGMLLMFRRPSWGFRSKMPQKPLLIFSRIFGPIDFKLSTTHLCGARQSLIYCRLHTRCKSPPRRDKNTFWFSGPFLGYLVTEVRIH